MMAMNVSVMMVIMMMRMVRLTPISKILSIIQAWHIVISGVDGNCDEAEDDVGVDDDDDDDDDDGGNDADYERCEP